MTVQWKRLRHGQHNGSGGRWMRAGYGECTWVGCSVLTYTGGLGVYVHVHLRCISHPWLYPDPQAIAHATVAAESGGGDERVRLGCFDEQAAARVYAADVIVGVGLLCHDRDGLFAGVLFFSSEIQF